MDEKEMKFTDFLSDISPEFAEPCTQIHEALLGKDCIVKLQLAKSGHVVSYSHPRTKKVIANFVSRKKGPVIRIYGDNVSLYEEILETLPSEMHKLIDKASACKRLIDPAMCNSRCPMGYVFSMGGTEHKKCRYSCFMFPVVRDHCPSILAILDSEIRQRAAE